MGGAERGEGLVASVQLCLCKSVCVCILAYIQCRLAFLSFCNHSDSRRLFVYPSHEGRVCVSATPPRRLDEKALFFLKAAHASRLSRESMQEDVVYSECSQLPLGRPLSLGTRPSCCTWSIPIPL